MPFFVSFRIGRARTGLGLFATMPIRKGTYVVEYTGPIMDSAAADAMEDRGNRYLFGRSYELGAIRLTKRFLNGKPFTRETFQRIYDHAWEEFRKHSPAEPPAADRAIASSGNSRAIVKMAETIRSPVFSKHIPEMTPGVLEDLVEMAVGKTPQHLVSLFDLNQERAHIIMPAVLVLLAGARYFGIRRMEFTDAGLREGVAAFWSRHGHLNLPLLDEEK